MAKILFDSSEKNESVIAQVKAIGYKNGKKITTKTEAINYALDMLDDLLLMDRTTFGILTNLDK